jgi:hypothetical protein
MRKMLLMNMKAVGAAIGAALFLIELSTVATAGPMNISGHFTCSGKIAKLKLGTGDADRSIGCGDSMCYFPSQSAVGHQILAACPLDGECQILGRVEKDVSAGECSPIITHVYKVQLRRDGPVNAASKETISQLGCPAVSQAGVARQPWSVGGSPYGVPLAQWDQDEFGLLRGRIADCAKQSGTDVRGLLAYVQHLESVTRSQNSASDPVRRQAAADEAHRHSQALNDAMVRSAKERERNFQAQKDVEHGVLEKVESYTSSADLTAYCRETSKSLPDSTRWDVVARCKEKLALLAMADRKAEEARQAEASANKLPDLIRKLDEMPADQETVRRLNDLLSDNHYRLPELSYHDQNSYNSAIEARLAKIGNRLTDAACDGVIAKLAVPAEIRDARVIDGLAGVSLTYFLCGPALTTKNVSVKLERDDTVAIAVDDVVLTLARRRYFADGAAAVAPDSPVKGGVDALVLTAATKGGRPVAVGNPNFFVINFYSQFTPQLAEFLRQSVRPPDPAKKSDAGTDYMRANCQMGECVWSALLDRTLVKQVPDGRLMRATMRICVVSYEDKDIPERYACRASEASTVEYAAFCSTKAPSVAYKDENGKWLRDSLSVSADGLFGYNTESMKQYLRVCHDYVGDEDLDKVGARFGYRSRQAQLGDDAQGPIDDVSQLVE